jgi:hypothetical protein
MIGLIGLGSVEHQQLDLFDTVYNRGKELEPLMQVFDNINSRYGRGTLKLGCGTVKSEKRKGKNEEMSNEQLREKREKGKGKNEEMSNEQLNEWEMKRDYLSPCYTTDIRDIPLAY